MKIKRKEKEKGFFVLEVMIAMLVFGVGILGLLHVYTASIANNGDAQNRVTAAYLAQNIIGQMILDKGNLENYTKGEGEAYEAWKEDVNNSLLGGADNPPEITIEEVDGVKKATIKIYWKTTNNENVSKYETDTLIY